MFRRIAALSLIFLTGCTCDGGGEPDAGPDSGVDAGFDAGTPSGRCEVELSGFIDGAGAARGSRIDTASQLLGGPNAVGKVGDFRLENEKIRVVVQAEGRAFGPLPYGGTIIDADLVGANAGNDQFGEVGLLYNFGRTVKPDQYELLSDGLDGGSVVVAISGNDTANDYLSIRNKLNESLGRVPYADPYVAMPLRITNYFVLNPGEQRVRFITGFCSTDNREITALAVGDLTDPGYVLEFFNPRACTSGFGFGGLCFSLDQMSWFGYQGDGVAYGYAPYRGGSALIAEPQNATLSVAGITGTIVGANGLLGLGSWVQESAQPRDGELRIPPRGFGVLARDFWVAKDLGAVSTLIESSRAPLTGAVLGDFSGTVRSGATPVAGARVVFEGGVDRAVFFTAADGTFSGKLPAGAYRASAWIAGRAPSAKQNVPLSVTPTTLSFDLAAVRRLTVNVREANGGPLPAKVTVLCANGPCAIPNRSLILYSDVTKDPLPDQIAHVGWVGPGGTATFELPAGQYAVLVSRGPEYSVHPPAYPTIPGQAIDVRTTDVTVNAVLARVIDTTGWMSADFHVHAVNSPDSIVDNAKRVLTFAGDGLDIIVSTDHDSVTDFAPIIAQTGLSPFLASVIGEEVSPMEWGHYNLFPLTFDPTNRTNGGALDWAGGEGPTLSVGEIFAEGRRLGARTIQVNHARGSLGGFSALQVDTDTLATHVNPELLRMAPQAGATAQDTKLISSDFDALEILNPGDDNLDGTTTLARGKFNDWFTLLSRGLLVAGTGVSDTHYALLATGWRTWVEVGVDQPSLLEPTLLSTRLNAMRAVTSNAPFVTARAYRVNAAGAMVTAPVGIGGVVPPDSRELGVTIEVQVPEYLDITKVELYLHVAGDDARCPLDPMSPRARTTRVSCGGVTNSNWPAASISATQAVTLTAGDRELVTTDGALSFYRYRKVVNFRLPAPTTDNWVVAMVYGSRSIGPLLYPYPGGGTTATPFAFTNPILIDADGNGYDHPPFAP
ncbi:MAG: CehA/McbA family metallohydrolase [Archangium sp.]|nr:CehA/McbA family metallohydrolase [Archangium sp.]MDP3151724.1 CehA/McbA family metallohydrolase [Archangium sp.]MDP3573242.1 CehA/McbA family metallohydrolase [Archangium sp.]